MMRNVFALVALTIVFASPVRADAPISDPMRLSPEWLEAPASEPAPGFEAEKGVRALYFAGPPYQGKPTRVFAWVGLPEKIEPGKKVPGIVLVHGGGGTAFAEWVRLWAGRGYAAIAMDTCGQIPRGTYGNWQRHPDGGPPGWNVVEPEGAPREDQWPYHAVGSVVLAHSLLRSMPEVDADRIGITGISWGGYLTCIVAGLDERLKFAVPVYGCGFLGENSTWKPQLEGLGDRGRRWLAMWDPKHYLPAAKMPMLWVTGTNDFAYALDSLQRSYRATPGDDTLCVRVRMPHGHGGPGENPKEILAFTDSVVRGGRKLPGVKEEPEVEATARVTYVSDRPITKAELNYTSAGEGPWQKREWKTVPAQIDATAARVNATLPPDARVYYMNLIDEEGLLVSTPHVEVAR